MWSRIHLIPLLQAEEDRDLVRRHLADQAREKELLGDNMQVYNSGKYVILLCYPPTRAIVRRPGKRINADIYTLVDT